MGGRGDLVSQKCASAAMIKMRGVALLLAFALAANTVSAGIVIEKASREVRAFSASICWIDHR